MWAGSTLGLPNWGPKRSLFAGDGSFPLIYSHHMLRRAVK